MGFSNALVSIHGREPDIVVVQYCFSHLAVEVFMSTLALKSHYVITGAQSCLALRLSLSADLSGKIKRPRPVLEEFRWKTKLR